MEYYSPLRYPGGKGKVAHYFKEIIAKNNLQKGVYVEPYAGGASVALALLLNEQVDRIIINDVDRSIYAFWHSVLNKTDALCKLIEKTPVNYSTWKKQKKIQKEKETCDLLTLGFSTFFLNRTNRSGILNAGVIGGKAQNSEWKINARYNKKELIKRIKLIAKYNTRIDLHNLDAVILVRALRELLPENTLFYFDPPYYVQGKALYFNHYNDNDHKEIAKEISRLHKQKWVVTYDNVHFIRQIYNKYPHFKFDLNYSAAGASKGEEIMIFSKNLVVPAKIHLPPPDS